MARWLKRNNASGVLFAGLVLVLSGCTKEKRDVVAGASVVTTTGPSTLSTIQEDVFRLGCAVSGCHDNRSNPAGSLSMTSITATYDQTVNQNSTQAIGKKLIVPGDSEESYFVNKLKGTHLSAGGSGARMPQYAASIPAGDLLRIIEWIDAGAQLN